MDPKFIEVDGAKFQADPNDDTKPLLDDKGEKIPFVEDGGGKKEEKKDDKSVDLSKVSIEELKKVNPDVAKILEDKEELETKLNKKKEKDEEAEEKKKKEQGKWQDLFEAEKIKRQKTVGELKKQEIITNRYKTTVNGILEETMKSIPEDKRPLIPEDFSARKKLDYINANAKILGVVVGVSKGGAIQKNDEDINLDEESKVQKDYEELLEKGKDRTAIETTQMLQKAKKLKEIRLANDKANANKK